MTTDREHWDERYADASEPGSAVPFVGSIVGQLPRSGTALDVAGGTGATALMLAKHGLVTTLVDVSPVALVVASEAADRAQLSLDTSALDLMTDNPPAGPWDVIVVANYLQRDLFPKLIARLTPGGLLAVAIATVTNLERNQHPSARFLLERGELSAMASGLDVVSLDEDWFGDRHEARLLARRF